jgi:hypothetical protein
LFLRIFNIEIGLNDNYKFATEKLLQVKSVVAGFHNRVAGRHNWENRK